MSGKNKAIEAALLVAEKVHERGGEVYYVGGYVRDKLLGRKNKDIDIEVHGIPVSELEEILSSIGDMLHYGKSFDIYALKGVDMLDISVPKTIKLTGTAYDNVPFIGTYEAARRRDFTVNSIMENVLTGDLSDPFNGVKDLENGILKHLGDETTFGRDPLRVFRAAQFAARYDFNVSNDTMELCRKIDTSGLHYRRVESEIEKALLISDKPSVFFETLRKMEQLDYWFPELKELIGVPQDQKKHREGNVWVHTMMVLDRAVKKRRKVKNPFGFMLAALCHDMGKAVCTEEKNGVICSDDHEYEGLPVIQRFLSRITKDRKLIKYVLDLTVLHTLSDKEPIGNICKTALNTIIYTNLECSDITLFILCNEIGRKPERSVDPEKLNKKLLMIQSCRTGTYVRGRDLLNMGIRPSWFFEKTIFYAKELALKGIPKYQALELCVEYAHKLIKKGHRKRKRKKRKRKNNNTKMLNMYNISEHENSADT